MTEDILYEYTLLGSVQYFQIFDIFTYLSTLDSIPASPMYIGIIILSTTADEQYTPLFAHSLMT